MPYHLVMVVLLKEKHMRVRQRWIYFTLEKKVSKKFDSGESVTHAFQNSCELMIDDVVRCYREDTGQYCYAKVVSKGRFGWAYNIDPNSESDTRLVHGNYYKLVKIVLPSKGGKQGKSRQVA